MSRHLQKYNLLATVILAIGLLAAIFPAQATDNRALKPVQMGAKRVALVIGNDHYKAVAPLQNAVADARAMAEALSRAGFNVTLKTDANLSAMKQAVREFKSNLSGGDEAVFFYSGHGVQLGSANYLLPTDIVSEDEEQVKDDAIPLQRVLDDLQDQKVKFALAIIDACRDNPFKGKGRSIGGARGLAPTSAANGQMVIFSAGNGQQALDRLGENDQQANGVFTRVFLEEMQKPGVEVHQVLRNVRSRVVGMARSVNHDQMPALYDQVEGDFLFYPSTVSRVSEVSELPKPASANVKTKEQIEDEYWDLIKGSNELAGFEQYLNDYPDGRYAGLAKLRIGKLRNSAVSLNQTTPVLRTPQTVSEPEMVRIPGKNFEIGKYEVTQKEWRDVMGSNPSRFSSCGDNCPVENVSWDDIKKFLQKINAKTGKQYRLPSEVEWEYACYGGHKTEYCGSNDIGSVAWYGGSYLVPPTGNSASKTHPIGQKQANSFGLYDMSGNVWEWVQDCYNGDCGYRVLRGGSWFNESRKARVADRTRNVPGVQGSVNGFRLARTLR